MAAAGEGEEASAGYGCAAPVGEAEGGVEFGTRVEGRAGVGKERSARGDGPVGGAVEVDDGEGGVEGGCGDEEGDGRGGSYSLVEEWDEEGSSKER